jgi:hypothetical protein
VISKSSSGPERQTVIRKRPGTWFAQLLNGAPSTVFEFVSDPFDCFHCGPTRHLHDFLEVALLETEDRGPDGHIFGPRKSSTFSPDKLQKRADEAWSVAKLDRITLHECRQTFASLMIAAGVNAKSLQEFMGHASITITLDRYGHLMPGSEAEAATQLDSYPGAQRERAEEAARSAELSVAGA